MIVGGKALQALRVLPASSHRLDIVVTRDATAEVPAAAVRALSFDEALAQATAAQVDRVYVLGGGELFREALGHFCCTDLHYTWVDGEFPGADTFFPDFETSAHWTRFAR